jgi:hypothetical protein
MLKPRLLLHIVDSALRLLKVEVAASEPHCTLRRALNPTHTVAAWHGKKL